MKFVKTTTIALFTIISLFAIDAVGTALHYSWGQYDLYIAAVLLANAIRWGFEEAYYFYKDSRERKQVRACFMTIDELNS